MEKAMEKKSDTRRVYEKEKMAELRRLSENRRE